jgi:lactate racemase
MPFSEKELRPFIYYQGKRVYFDIPYDWNLLTFAKLEIQRRPSDVRKLVMESLNRPIGLPAIKNMVSPADQIAIIIEDITRTSPKKILLETLLNTLRSLDISEKKIKIVVALGTHKKLTPEEMRNTFGSAILKPDRCSYHTLRGNYTANCLVFLSLL